MKRQLLRYKFDKVLKKNESKSTKSKETIREKLGDTIMKTEKITENDSVKPELL